MVSKIKFLFQVERLAEQEKNLKAKRGWFGFLWGSGPTEEEQDLNSAAAISGFYSHISVFILHDSILEYI